MRGVLVVIVTIMLSLTCRPAGATVGGPTEVEMLGGSPSEHRVYFSLTRHDEGSGIPRVFYIAWADSLGRPGSGKPVPLWADVTAAADTGRWDSPASRELTDRIGALKGTLLGLLPASGDSARVMATTTKQDSVRLNPYDPPTARYRLHVDIAQDDYAGSDEVTAYCRKGGRVISWLRLQIPGPPAGGSYRAPAEAFRLAIFAYTGDPFESCYEVQDVILLKRRAPRVTPRH